MSHAGVFTHPFMYWVGMDTDPRTTEEALAEFNRFYSTIHVHEVLAAHPGFVSASRYELLDQDPRGGVHAGPRWLAVYEMADQAAAEQYVKDNARPWLHRRRYSPWPPARKRAKTVWRMIWRQISASGATDRLPESVLLVGLNPPPEADADAVADTRTHLPEGMAAGGFARATRCELYRAFAHPAPGCPRFCAIYAADAAAPETRHAPAWETRDAAWRLVYRRLPSMPAAC